jgi:hypothetical protein
MCYRNPIFLILDNFQPIHMIETGALKGKTAPNFRHFLSSTAGGSYILLLEARVELEESRHKPKNPQPRGGRYFPLYR